MKSLYPVLQSLTLPTGATVGQARTVYNSAVPAELVTYYGGLGMTIAACTISYFGGGTDRVYGYTVNLGTSGITRIEAMGIVDTLSGTPVRETQRTYYTPPDGANTVISGDGLRVNSQADFNGQLNVNGNVASTGLAVGQAALLNRAGKAAQWPNATYNSSGGGMLNPLVVAATDVPGFSTGFTTSVALAILVASASFDFNCTVAGATTAIGLLNVDGVDQPEQVLCSFGAGTGRSTPGRTWTVPLLAGAHTVKLRARITGGAATYATGGQHTNLNVDVRE